MLGFALILQLRQLIPLWFFL
jgi:hypothetical protein